MESSTETKLILSSKTQWDEWFIYATEMAILLDVWDLVDPSKGEPELLPKPELPKVTAFKKDATSIIDLSNEERNLYIQPLMVYREEMKIWDVQNNGLKRTMEWISNAISREIKYNMWTQKDEDGKKYSKSPYAMLKGLQHLYGPTEESRIYDLTKEYQALQRYPRSRPLQMG
ncbi:hypothetical protein VTO42DRAFT_1098 [Malbranchea cinnamomea]